MKQQNFKIPPTVRASSWGLGPLLPAWCPGAGLRRGRRSSSNRAANNRFSLVKKIKNGNQLILNFLFAKVN
jgi:hypothetical protein